MIINCRGQVFFEVSGHRAILAGRRAELKAALVHDALGLRAINAPFALAVACDMPFLNPRLLRYMADLTRDYDALVPSIGGIWQPLHTIYAKACLTTVEDLLARGLLALTDLLTRVRVRALRFATIRRFDPEGLSFLNINEPDDLMRVRAITYPASG